MSKDEFAASLVLLNFEYKFGFFKLTDNNPTLYVTFPSYNVPSHYKVAIQLIDMLHNKLPFNTYKAALHHIVSKINDDN